MRFHSYIKDKMSFIISQSILCLILLKIFRVAHLNTYITVLTTATIIMTDLSVLLVDFFVRASYYNRLKENLRQVEQKQFIAGILEKSSFAEGKILCDVIQEAAKAMNDQIAAYEIAQEEYQEYMETWIHEIKTPLACLELLCRNNQNELTRKIEEETRKIDQYVEQVLYYARSTNVVVDYTVKKCLLSDVVKSTVKKYSKQLIACNTQLNFKLGDLNVYADAKWLEFIIGQVITNSLKYSQGHLKLSFEAFPKPECVVLQIIDNGSGIPENDLPRVFEKGFTGQNGRRFAKSTGIGLYLCKTLCQKMYLDIRAQSGIGSGTTIEIIFPRENRFGEM